MSNGPGARVSEEILVNIPKPRNRASIVKDPGYYKIRNYLVDFLVNRSGTILEQLSEGVIADDNFPITIDPTKNTTTNLYLKKKAV